MWRLFKLWNSDYLSTTGTRVVILVGGLLNSIVLARLLNPVGRGEVAAAVLWPTLLVYVAAFGMFEATIYFASQTEFSEKSVYANSLVFLILASAVAIFIGYFILPSVLGTQTAEVVSLSRLYLLSIPFTAIARNNLSIFQARLQMRLFNALTIITPVGNAIGATALALTGNLTVYNAVLLQLAFIVGYCLSSFFMLGRSGFLIGLTVDLRLMRRMLSYGGRVYIGSLFFQGNTNLDKVFLAALLSPENLGLYTVAVRVVETTSVTAIAMRFVSMPAISREKSQENRVARLVYHFQAYNLVSLSLKAALALLLPVLIPLIYGQEFAAAVIAAEILLVASLFFDASTVLGGALQALEKPWLASRAEVVSFAATILTLPLLVPALGILGAAWSSLLAYALAFLVIIMTLRRLYGVRITELIRLKSGLQAVKTHLRSRTAK